MIILLVVAAFVVLLLLAALLLPKDYRIQRSIQINSPSGKVYDAFVDVATTRILKWEELNDVQPIVRAPSDQPRSHDICKTGSF